MPSPPDCLKCSPYGVTFNNSTKDYTLTSTGGFGITGSSSLTKSGTGKLTILNPNSYTGPTTINAGTLEVGTGGSLGNSPITGAGNFTKSGTDTLTIRPGNLTGTVSVEGGTLQLARAPGLNEGSVAGSGNRDAVPTSYPSAFLRPEKAYVFSNADGSGNTYAPWTTDITYVYKGRIYFPGNADGNNVRFEWHIDDNGYLEIDGYAWRDWGGPDWNRDGTAVLTPGWHDFEFRCGNGWWGAGPEGTRPQGWDPDGAGPGGLVPLLDPGNGSLFTRDTSYTLGPVVLSNDAILKLDGNNLTVGSLAGGVSNQVALDGGTLTVGANNTNTAFAGAINGAGNLVKTGTGKLTLSGASTYTGSTTVNGGGALSVSAGNNLGTGPTVSVSGGSTLEITGATAFDSGKAVLNIGTGGATVKVDNTAGASLGAVPTGTETLTKSGPGSLTLPAYSTGPTNIAEGTLKVGLPAPGLFEGSVPNSGNRDAVPTSWPATYLRPEKAYVYCGNSDGFGHTYQPWGNDITYVYKGWMYFPGNADGNNVRFEWHIDDNGYLRIDGQPWAGRANPSWDANDTAVMTPGWHQYEFRAGNGWWGAGPTSTVGWDPDGAGPGGIVPLVDPGDGSLFRTGSPFPVMKTVTIAGGAALDLNGNDTTAGSLIGAAGSKVLLGAKTLTVGTDNSSTAFSGEFDGAGRVTKTGSGTLTLTAAHPAFTGATTVNAGTILLSSTGSLANSGVTVKNGGTLQAATSVKSLVMESGGKLNISTEAPAVGAQLTAGAVNLNAGSILNYKFAPDGSANDLLIVSEFENFTAPSLGGGTVGLNLYQGTGATTFAMLGSYNLVQYDGFGNPETSAFAILNPVGGRRYVFGIDESSSPKYLTLDITLGPIWTGGGADDNWSTAANWTVPPSPAWLDVLTFDGSTRTTNLNDPAQTVTNFMSLYFPATAGAFTLNGNGVTLAGDVDKAIVKNESANTQTINLPITLPATATGSLAVNAVGGPIVIGPGGINTNGVPLLFKGASDTTVNGVIGGGGGITKAESGKLVLNNTQTYQGATTVNGGTLQVDGTLNTQTSGVAVNGATLSGAGTINRPVTLGSSANFGSSGTLSLGSTLTVTGGNNTLTGGTVAVTGATTVNSGGGLTVSGTLTTPTLAANGLLAAPAGMVWVSNQYQNANGSLGVSAADPAKPFGLSGADLSKVADVTLKGGTTTITVSPSLGLRGYWTFDGNPNDSSGYGHNGTLQGTFDGSQWVAGRIGSGAIHLAGTASGLNQFVEVGSVGPDFNGGKAARTIAGWVKLDGPNQTGWTNIFGFADNTGNNSGRFFDIEVMGGTSFGLHNYAMDNFIANLDTSWHFFAATLDPDGHTQKTYMDGRYMGTFDNPNLNITNWFVMGKRPEQTHWLAGYVDDVRAYNRALSGEEVASLYSSVASVSTTVNVLEASTLNTVLSGATIESSLQLGDLNMAADVTLGNAGMNFRNLSATATSAISGSPLTLRGSEVAVSDSAVLTINPDLLGIATLTKTGGGTLALPNPKSFSGNLLIGSGSVRLGDANAIANARLGATGAGGTLEVTGGTVNVIGLVGNGPLTIVPGGVNLNIGASGVSSSSTGSLNGSGTINKLGGGDQTIIGPANGSAGAFTGTINVAAPGSLTLSPGAVGAGALLNVPAGATLKIVGSPVSKFTSDLWTVNGSATASADGGVLTLTQPVNGLAGSGFLNSKVAVDSPFSASFIYQGSDSSQGNPADGATIVLQNDPQGVNALRGGGGDLGYGGMSPSVAVAINIYNGHVIGTNGFVNGDLQGGTYISTAPVDPRSGRPIRVDLNYDGTSVSESLTDLITGDTWSGSIPVGSLSTILGGNQAYVGFTAGTGGLNARQTISNFTYNLPGTSPVMTLSAPIGGGAVEVYGATVVVDVLNAYGGATTMHGGALQMNKPLTTPSLTVASAVNTLLGPEALTTPTATVNSGGALVVASGANLIADNVVANGRLAAPSGGVTVNTQYKNANGTLTINAPGAANPVLLQGTDLGGIPHKITVQGGTVQLLGAGTTKEVGLSEVKLTGSNNYDPVSPWPAASRLRPEMAYIYSGADGSGNTYPPWSTDTTYAYHGWLYFPGNATNQARFEWHIDDWGWLKIDGTQRCDPAWDQNFITSLSPGWHEYEFRCGNGWWGAGPTGAVGWDPGTGFANLVDAGDGSLFRTVVGLGSPATELAVTANTTVDLAAADEVILGQLTLTNSAVAFTTAPQVSFSGIAATGTSAIAAGPAIRPRGGNFEVSGGSVLTVNPDVVGDATVTKTGDGRLVLSGIGTYTGGTTVEAGTLEIASSAALPAGRAVTIGAGGTLVLSSGLSAGAGGASQSAAPVPEPGTFVLLAAAMIAGLALWLRRWTRK